MKKRSSWIADNIDLAYRREKKKKAEAERIKGMKERKKELKRNEKNGKG